MLVELTWEVLVVKNLPANQCRSRLDLWVGKIPGRRAWQPTPVFFPGKSHGQKFGGLQSTGVQSGHHGSPRAQQITHTCVKPPGLGLSFVGSFEITDSISLLVTDLFPFSTSVLEDGTFPGICPFLLGCLC